MLAHEREVLRRQHSEANQFAFIVLEGKQLEPLGRGQHFAARHRFLPAGEARSMAFN
jgi:hypothetical protein